MWCEMVPTILAGGVIIRRWLKLLLALLHRPLSTAATSCSRNPLSHRVKEVVDLYPTANGFRGQAGLFGEDQLCTQSQANAEVWLKSAHSFFCDSTNKAILGVGLWIYIRMHCVGSFLQHLSKKNFFAIDSIVSGGNEQPLLEQSKYSPSRSVVRLAGLNGFSFSELGFLLEFLDRSFIPLWEKSSSSYHKCFYSPGEISAQTAVRKNSDTSTHDMGWNFVLIMEKLIYTKWKHCMFFQRLRNFKLNPNGFWIILLLCLPFSYNSGFCWWVEMCARGKGEVTLPLEYLQKKGLRSLPWKSMSMRSLTFLSLK